MLSLIFDFKQNQSDKFYKKVNIKKSANKSPYKKVGKNKSVKISRYNKTRYNKSQYNKSRYNKQFGKTFSSPNFLRKILSIFAYFVLNLVTLKIIILCFCK